MSDVDDIERYRRELVTPGMTAGEFAMLLPERLRPTYWRQKIEQLCREHGDSGDET